jgi:hypothetical protein
MAAEARHDERTAASWAVMRALLDGREADARAALDLVTSLSAGDRAATDRAWLQRFWLVLAWGDEDERYQVLDHCRERAYRYDDTQWRGRLTLLLACMGKVDEAERSFDLAAERAFTGATRPAATRDAAWLDLATDLAEAAAVLASPTRAEVVHRALKWPSGRLVVAGDGAVCKGSIARYWAVLAATTGRRAEADQSFKAAADAHRALGAEPLLAATLHQWALSLTGRDDNRAAECRRAATELASRLRLSWPEPLSGS